MIRRRKESIIDFEDLQTAIKDAGCNVVELEVHDFFHFQSGLSDYNLTKAGTERPYLSDITSLEFQRGSREMFYKVSHQGENLRKFVFLKKNYDPNKNMIKRKEGENH